MSRNAMDGASSLIMLVLALVIVEGVIIGTNFTSTLAGTILSYVVPAGALGALVLAFTMGKGKR